MVQIDDLSRIIDEHPFAHGMDDNLRALIVGCAANERYDAGQYVLREGGRADKFFLIRAGAVALEIASPSGAIMVETLSDGDLLGWSWLSDPPVWTFDARATQLTRVISFDANCLRRKMDADPALGYEVLRRFLPIMAQRIHAARIQMLDLYGPGPQR